MSIISAGNTTTTAYVVTGDTTGNLVFQTQGGANTITVANQTGTLNAAGPTFSAYTSIATSVPNATFTKLQNNVEEFDTASCYDNATNYRFTPNVAGYYQINGAWATNGSTSIMAVAIFKNGANAKVGTQVPNSTAYCQATVSALIYLNGSTDYVELAGYQSTGGTLSAYTGTQPAYGYFQGYLVRGA